MVMFLVAAVARAGQAPVPESIMRARGFVLQLVGGEGQMSCSAAVLYGL